MRRSVMLLWLLLTTVGINAAELAPGIKLEPKGTIVAAGIRMMVLHFSTNWKMLSQSAHIKQDTQKQEGDTTIVDGVFEIPGGVLAINERISPAKTANAEAGCAITYTLKSDPRVHTEQAAVTLTLPVADYSSTTMEIDGKSFTLPVEFDKFHLDIPGKMNHLVLPTAKGNLIIQGHDLRVVIQDDRKYGTESFSFRILMDFPADKQLAQSTLTFHIFVIPNQTNAFNLRPVANASFHDDVKEDQKGGWTDQGDNDLRMFPYGQANFVGLEFPIISPSENEGKSCIILGNQQLSHYPKEITMPAPEFSGAPAHLYLLHAAAWIPPKGELVGTVVAEYQDGTHSSHELKSMIDIGNWWGPVKLEQAAVAWKGENPYSEVGLYVTRLPLQGKPLKNVQLVSGGKAVWMVIGMSMSRFPIPLPKEVPCTITAGREWSPFIPESEIIPGSIMDFSELTEVPAGKHGKVIVRDGNFVFSELPGKRVRFVGANLCFSANFLEKEDADRLAQLWRQMGYNSVRLHHYDQMLCKKGTGIAINPEMQDKLDYLFAAMKNAGQYITIDLYTIRSFSIGEIAGVNTPIGMEIKALLPIHPGAFDAWGKMALQLLNHVNPYTGMSWKDDPALFSICPVNEDSIFITWDKYPEIKKLYLERFEAWLSSRKLSPESPSAKDALLAQFLIETKIEFGRKLAEFFRQHGVHSLLTGCNFLNCQNQALMRSDFDFVDNHQYWDHPAFLQKAWALPHAYHQRSAIRAFAETPRSMMPTRIYGKPFTVTEYNFTPPNRYRAEAGAVMGAYAALQDWDGLYRFAWSHNDMNIISHRALNGFDAATDPVSLLTEKQIVLLFRRGDVSPATKRFAYALTSEEAANMGTCWENGGFPAWFSRLGLQQQIGSQIVSQAKPILDTFDGVTSTNSIQGKMLGENVYIGRNEVESQINGMTLTSGTGQIGLATEKGILKVNTPKTAILVVPDGASASTEGLRVESVTSFCSVSASAMDDKPLTHSGKILLFHITNVLNSDMRFSGEDMTVLEDWGKLPLLVKNGSAQIFLKTIIPDLKVWAITLSGKRMIEIPSEHKNGELIFSAKIANNASAPVMAYEISR